MSKNEIGGFGVLVLGIIILLIPVTSILNAQEYGRYYQGKRDTTMIITNIDMKIIMTDTTMITNTKMTLKK